MNKLKLLAVSILFTLSGCGWVDSTGSQPNSEQAVVDPMLVLLNPNEVFAIEENMQRTLVFNGPDSQVRDWTWNLLEGQANLNLCEGIDGFDRSIASNSLSQSCADENNCSVNIEEEYIDDVTQFQITTPHMRAPAALEFRFTAQMDSGNVIEQRRTFCAIAVNNPPVPQDDRVTVMQGTLLQVDGTSILSLLANDADDIDVRNQPLRVDPTPVRAPRFASRFELFTDGGFIYEPATNAPISLSGSVSDSFDYLVTDGNESGMATVSIKISDVNTAPTLTSMISDITISVGDSSEIAFLQSYFSDAENDVLLFSVDDGSLPASGNIFLTDDGELAGIAEEEDTGLYFVNVTVSDSIESIDAGFFLTIIRDGVRNSSPSVTDIDNTTVRGEFSYDVSVFFDDANGDHLFFTAINLPPGVFITPDGVIFGTSTDENEGNWLIRVTADDGNGGRTDDGFRMRIR